MSLEFLEQTRNESMARRELTIQSHALLVVRTLDSIYSALQRKPFDGIDFDVLAAIMYLFDAMLYYADRERQPGMTRKEAELCLVEHLREAYPGHNDPGLRRWPARFSPRSRTLSACGSMTLPSVRIPTSRWFDWCVMTRLPASTISSGR